MKVLITGTYGFLGRYTAKKFKKEGFHVTGIGHGKWYQEEFSKWGIDVWVESTITFEALINTNQEFDIIVHCGGSGSVGFSTVNPYEDFQKSVQSTLGLLEYIRLRAPKTKFIYPSSVAVQGSMPDIAIQEEMQSSPISPYGFHKKIAEDLCRSYHINFGIITGVIRFFSIYGDGLQKQLIYDACKKIGSANSGSVIFYGTGEETRDWIHVKDAATLIYNFGLQLVGNDLINGGSGERVEIKEILELLSQEFDTKVSIEFNGQAREGDPKYFWADTTKANNYNWKPTVSLTEGIKLYVQYYKNLER
jgi:UDP-glucose 4-epimerase